MNTPEPSTQRDEPQELPLPGMPTVQPARSATRVIRRKPILSESNDVTGRPETAERSAVTYTVAQHQGGPGSNQRRYRHMLKLILVVVLANNLLIAGGVVWFVYYMLGDLEGRLQGPVTHTHVATAPPSANNAEIEKQSAALEARFTQKISDLQKELGETRQQNEAGAKQQQEAHDKQVADLTRRIADLAAQAQNQAKSAPASQGASPIAAETNNNPLDLPPSQTELVTLKERNRLTSYADEAIATGSRDAYEQLWKALSDPRLANLVHAARAEILRVQECYLSGQRAKYYGIQGYQIPIPEIFPDAGSLTAAQLSDDQLIHVLQDKKVPWQARVKAAWYLGRHRTTKVGDALVKAVKEDPMLDVEAEATFSFEQVTGFRAKLFEPENLEAWWLSYKSAPPSNGPSKGKEKPADEKPSKMDKGESKSPPAENKSSKTDEAKDKDKENSSAEKETKESKPASSDKKSAKSEDDKDSDGSKGKKGKKEEIKKANIPLREPDEKP
jgi:hypothetical protein